MNELKPPYIHCPGCGARGFTMHYDEEAGKRIPLDHERCNGAGILILRPHLDGGQPYYGKPKLY